ncbi:ABC transporter permease [Betaproteobacteria bacterium]|nr:ABC transporter permease [Betaproteobacteria bacterium]
MLAVFLFSLFGLIVIGLPVAMSLIATGAIMVFVSTGGIPYQILAQGMYRGIDNFPLLAIPFFMLAGEIMNVGGISDRIVRFSKTMIGHIPGGLGYATVIASMLFAAISGSAIASVSAIGAVLIPMMRDNKYDVDTSTALVCTASCLGPIIPPSIPMILYAVNANVSVMDMFLGGIIPGVLIAFALMLVWFFHSKKAQYPRGKRASAGEMLLVTRETTWALFLPIIIMGGIISGIATPTESAVVAVVYSLIVSMFVYRELRFSQLKKVFVNAGLASGATMFFVGGATAVSYMITTAHIPELLTDTIFRITTDPYAILLLLNILMLLVGCVMDVAPAVMILTPILVPLIKLVGIDPLLFGVVMCTNLILGLLTPPVGAVLYIGCSLSKRNILQICKAMLPYLCVMIVVLLTITYCGQLITFIPNLLK